MNPVSAPPPSVSAAPTLAGRPGHVPDRAPDRALEIAGFLDQQGWGDAAATPFAGDFSPRRYARLTRADGATAILMDADADQNTPAFAAVAGLLRARGIMAPEIYAARPERGLMLLQDFGGRNVGALIDAGADPKLYFLTAAALLARLHARFDRADAAGLDLPLFNADLLTRQAELFLDAYFPCALQREATDEERRDFRAALQAVLRPVEVMPKSLLLRDFMPDNLMDLPNNELGVLDFQDAGIGPIAYDLASLCEEVRRDGLFALLPEIIAYYKEQAASPLSEADLLRGATIMSAARHIRVMGIVAALALKTGRRDKMAFLPRIRRHMARLLREPYLRPLAEWWERAHVG